MRHLNVVAALLAKQANLVQIRIVRSAGVWPGVMFPPLCSWALLQTTDAANLKQSKARPPTSPAARS